MIRADGHLPLPDRRRARLELDGHAQRFALARSCAEIVLWRWEAARPADRRPHAMIGLAERVLAGASDVRRALLESAAFTNDAYELIDEIGEPALNAAMAATRLIVPAGWDDDAEMLDEPHDDEDRDSDEWETAFWASMVDAPSLPKMGVAEHVAPRRRFWTWYLEEALPAARRGR